MTVRKISKLVSSMHCMGVTALDGITSWVVLVMWCSACCSGKEVSLIIIEIIEYTERERERESKNALSGQCMHRIILHGFNIS
jgi:hypothetical protein